MVFDLPPVRELEGYTHDNLDDEVLCAREPVLLKGLVNSWPAVTAGRQAPEVVTHYLRRFYTGQPLTAYVGDSEIEGRFFYNDSCTNFNFKRGTATLTQVFDKLRENRGDPDAQSIYVGSTMVDKWFPGFRKENDITLPIADPLASIWIGNQSRVSAHFDFPDNIACIVAGNRRFTLFPPDQLENLYIGPIDLTPSGQAISMVDFARPDFTEFPKFKRALETALVADMEPGDALFLPSMWWHHVEALSDLNVLVNYWWCSSPLHMGSPSLALKHALLALRDLPKEQRAIWQQLFNHYVFEANDESIAHIPEPGRGILSELDELKARQLRAEIINRLNQ